MRGGNAGRVRVTHTLNKKRRDRYVVEVQRDRFGKRKAKQLEHELDDEDLTEADERRA